MSNFDSRNNLFDISRVGCYVVNDSNPSGYVFTLNRLGLISNDKSTQFESLIRNLIHDGYREFLKATDSYTPNLIYELNYQSFNMGGFHTGYYTQNRLAKLRKQHSDLICFKLLKLNNSETHNTCPTEYCDLNGLLKKDILVWSYESFIVIGNLRIHPEDSTDTLYDIIKQNNSTCKNSYLLPAGHETLLFFDNADNSFIRILTVKAGNTEIKIPFLCCYASKAKIQDEHPWHMGNVRGLDWAGAILERNIEGATFAFLGQQKVVIQKDSSLAIHIRQLFNLNQHQKLSTLIKRLDDYDKGFVHDSIHPFVVK